MSVLANSAVSVRAVRARCHDGIGSEHNHERPKHCPSESYHGRDSHTDEGAVHRVHRFAESLARPVALGYLPRSLADAAILLIALKADCGRLDQIEIARFSAWLLRRKVRDRDDIRTAVEYRIARALGPLIAQREKRNILRRTAHDTDAGAGSPTPRRDQAGGVRTDRIGRTSVRADNRRGPVRQATRQPRLDRFIVMIRER